MDHRFRRVAPEKLVMALLDDLLKGHVQSRLGLRLADSRRSPSHKVQPSPASLVEGWPAAPEYLRLHHHRNPHIRSRAHLDSEKYGRGHSYYLERIVVDRDGLAEDGGIGAEPLPPVMKAEHGQRMPHRDTVVGAGECAAQDWLNA